MRDPLTWSLPCGRLFGIGIRVHWMFPAVALALICRFGIREPHYWYEAISVMGLLFLSVVLHEFGHCFGARSVEGDAQEIMLWPLGGLAYVEVPNTPWANLVTAVSGPLMNLLVCALCGMGLAALSIRPPFSWFWPVPWNDLVRWDGTQWTGTAVLPLLLARLFWVNWVLFTFNMVLVGFPMDSARILQALLWYRVGFRQATTVTLFIGFIVSMVVGAYGLFDENTLLLLLGLFIFYTCRTQWIILETGGEESQFGYDFSQGYTSLEREAPPRRRRPSAFRRWLQRRAQKKLEREQELREREERRMDELLEKVQREGLPALTEEERRFLTRVSARYRHRK